MVTLEELRTRAAGCTNCGLYRDATQTVFGVGRPGARLLLLGEQPGDAEDTEGEPFVGPAGGVLDRALTQAGISRSEVYVTNVVKHFKFRRVGKRRIHQTPTTHEVKACLPWLTAELEAVAPAVVTTLGATAAKALLGSSFRLTKHRGEVLEYAGLPLVATIHPSAVLRTPDKPARDAALDGLAEDLRLAAKIASHR
jgi:DNA polymerase